MEPSRKISLIRDIDIINKIRSFNLDSSDYELCQSISDVICKLGLLVLGVIETAEPTCDYLEPAHALFLDLLVLNIMFIECDDTKSAQYIVRFLNAAVLYLKRMDALSETLLEVIAKIQDVCIAKIQYPDW